ncbi:MAG: hypothetical protein EOO39_02240 [Cytophagaceae bacterium]|nr:MAG: hypothetical protein EOO39_02240 [Cytophagaceae bacterium]
MKNLLLLLLTLFTVACSDDARPPCTLQQDAAGAYQPYGDCSDCEAFTVLDPSGTQRPMGEADMDRYVRQNPPSAVYNPSSPSLSDYMLMHFLLNGSGRTHYQTVYAPQYSSYTSYRRSHPGYVAPRRFVNKRYVTNTTVINRTVYNNKVVNKARPSAASRMWGKPKPTITNSGRSYWGSTSRSTTTSSPVKRSSFGTSRSGSSFGSSRSSFGSSRSTSRSSSSTRRR